MNGMDIFTFVAITVFPLINEWRAQWHDARRGDHSAAGRNFLWGTLPYLALVAFQDGIYWINDFPQHEASRMLLHIMPQTIANKQRDVEAVQISVMNNAVQAAFNLMAVRLDDVNQSMAKVFVELEQQKTAAAAAARPGYPRANFQPPEAPPPQMQRRVGQQPGAAGTALIRNVNDRIRAVPLVPAFPPALPPTMTRPAAGTLRPHIKSV
jgi:hypothetical protein